MQHRKWILATNFVFLLKKLPVLLWLRPNKPSIYQWRVATDTNEAMLHSESPWAAHDYSLNKIIGSSLLAFQLDVQPDERRNI